MRTASLFAGIGGFDLAMHRLGLPSSLVSEIDPAARKVLQARFPDARLAGDATKVDLRGFQLVTAGFPCQGLSPAAATRKHEGLSDDRSRSHVVWAVIDRIAEAEVPYVLLENSSALTTLRYTDDMKLLLGRLAGHGYDARVYVLNAGCYGTPMRRTRAFILARRGGARLAWPGVEASVKYQCDEPVICVAGQQGGATWCAQPSPTLKAASYTLVVTADDVRSLRPEALEVLFGFPVGHTSAAGSNAQRYARLGNTVSVDAATVALQILLTGKAPPVRAPDRAYPLALTTSARGGTSGSMVRRIYRGAAQSLRSPNHNRIEVDYALPVYARRMTADTGTVTPDQAEALRWLIGQGTMPATFPHWPTRVGVEMTQVGLLPLRA